MGLQGKKWGTIILVIIIFITSFGCTKKVSNQGTNKSEPPLKTETESPQEENNGEKDTEVESEELEVIVSGIPSPLSGIIAPEEKINRRPLAVIFDNHTKARPQAGLIDAEIAYEYLVEGGITRYLGIFLVNEPETLGGVRSARRYLIQKALEYDSYLVHVGGSDEAFQDIPHYKVASINGLYRGKDVFWRKNHKIAPHNMYTSHDALRNAARKSKFRSQPKFSGFKFNKDIMDITGENAKNVYIVYQKGYQPSYEFDEENKLYQRFYNGKPHIDEVSKEQLSCTNIIIQEVHAKVVDEYLRLHMDTIGEGKGLYITNGKVIDITWMKDRYEGPTTYYSLDGKELVLNPGQTWVQVVKNLQSVVIKE